MKLVARTWSDAVVRRALFGVRLRDAVTGRVVVDGITVRVKDRLHPYRNASLQASHGGVFALHEIWRQAGFGDDQPDSPAQDDRWRFRVDDPLDRYLPTSFRSALPVDGLVGMASLGLGQAWSPASPASSPGLSPAAQEDGLPLFSAATRSPPPGFASLRAELRFAGDDQRAVPWARLELRLGDSMLADGFADRNGRVLLVFPWPRPRELLQAASGPAEWPVTLHASWHPDRLSDGVPDPDRRLDGVPDLSDLFAQPDVTLLQGASRSQPLAGLNLRYGEPLLVASASSSFLYVAA
jgi:hypothetical protein